MAQTGYTPLLIYASGTASNVPLAANLTSSASGAELALNYADGRLFYKDSGGVVQVLATKGTGAIGGSNTQVQYNSSGSLAGSANLTFDGTNLGVGTSSPGAKLDIGGTNNTVFFKNSGATTGYALATVSNTSGAFQYGVASSTGTFWGSGNAGNYSVNIGSTSATNLGFGTSDTLRMLLDSSGNLGIGTSSPAVYTANSRLLQIDGGANATEIKLTNSTTGATGADGTLFQLNGSAFYLWNLENSFLSFGTNNTERARIDSSGNLDLGTTGGSDRYQNIIATSAKLTFNAGTGFTGSAATSIYNQSAIAMVFGTNNTERARITSGGDLLVGATSTINSAKLLVSATGSDAIIRISNNTSGNAVLDLATEGVDAGALFYERSTSRLYAKNSSSGGVYLSTNATAWTAVSDERFKTALTPIEDAASKVSSLRAVTGRYKTDAEDVSRSFLIAQDVQAVFPEAVNADNPDELGLSYTDMVPLLVAAIKEQQALITSLTARIAALEAK